MKHCVEQPTRQPGTRCTYGCPYKTHTKFLKTVIKQVQLTKMKAIKLPPTEWQNDTKEEIKKPLRMQKNPHP